MKNIKNSRNCKVTYSLRQQSQSCLVELERSCLTTRIPKLRIRSASKPAVIKQALLILP